MNEKERVLKMVEEGKLNAIEALKLLEALGKNASSSTPHDIVPVETKDEKAKFLRIKVTSNKDNLNFTIPIALVSMGLGMVNSLGVDISEVKGFSKVNFSEILEQIEKGAKGKIFDLQTENESIEIFIE